eukprot:scaffold2570_cov436-Prasinococcus_capsulatus_cf.AAC.7
MAEMPTPIPTITRPSTRSHHSVANAISTGPTTYGIESSAIHKRRPYASISTAPRKAPGTAPNFVPATISSSCSSLVSNSRSIPWSAPPIRPCSVHADTRCGYFT